jgi:hypothetical protein
VIWNSIIWGNTTEDPSTGDASTISYSIIEVEVNADTSSNNKVNIDPIFKASIPPAPSTVSDYSLQSTSLAINAGNYADYPGTWA